MRKLFSIAKQITHSRTKLVFKRIDGLIFALLYSGLWCRTKVQVNSMVSSLILLTHNCCSYEILIRQKHFDILIHKALGISYMVELLFYEATLIGFKNRIMAYEVEAGINLIEQVFSSLTAEQLAKQKLKVKPEI